MAGFLFHDSMKQFPYVSHNLQKPSRQTRPTRLRCADEHFYSEQNSLSCIMFVLIFPFLFTINDSPNEIASEI